MTIELCRFSLQDVFCSLKLTVLAILLLVMMSLIVCSFVCGNIVGFRVWKLILRREFDLASAFVDNQNFISRILRHESVRRPLVKGVICLFVAVFIGFITMLYCVIFLTR